MSKYMNFGDAIASLKAGKRVARGGWNGKGMWLILIKGSRIPVLDIRTPYGDALGEVECEILPHIDMYTTDQSGRKAMLPGWVASQSDMLSEDWLLVE